MFVPPSESLTVCTFTLKSPGLVVGACSLCSLSRRAVLTELKLTSGGEVLEITQSSLSDLTEFCLRDILNLLAQRNLIAGKKEN